MAFDETLATERARTEAWTSAFHLAEERKRLDLTQRQVADLMGVAPARVSQIETVIWPSTRCRSAAGSVANHAA